MFCKSCGVELDDEEELCGLCMIFSDKDSVDKGIVAENKEIIVEDEGITVEEQKIGSPKGLYFNNAEYNYLNSNTIWSFRQNIPELIVNDCIKEFNLDDEEVEKLRIILMARGVNKWFYARREFIKLKHEVKEMLKSAKDDKKVHRIIEKIYVKMQNIAKMPRHVEWPRTVTHKWENIERDIEIKGKHC